MWYDKSTRHTRTHICFRTSTILFLCLLKRHNCFCSRFLNAELKFFLCYFHFIHSMDIDFVCVQNEQRKNEDVRKNRLCNARITFRVIFMNARGINRIHTECSVYILILRKYYVAVVIFFCSFVFVFVFIQVIQHLRYAKVILKSEYLSKKTLEFCLCFLLYSCSSGFCSYFLRFAFCI